MCFIFFKFTAILQRLEQFFPLKNLTEVLRSIAIVVTLTVELFFISLRERVLLAHPIILVVLKPRPSSGHIYDHYITHTAPRDPDPSPVSAPGT